MSYNTAKAELYKRPITIVDITMGYCSRVWNTAPCTPGAGSTYCFNTFPTCVDSLSAGVYLKTNFGATTKTYQFCKTTDLQISDLIRPYIVSISDLPQKISNKITVKQRITIEMQDEPDTDIGIDPYYSSRTGYTTPAAIPGTFWQKWMARNPNYRNATVKVKEGFEGLAEVDFQITFVGTIDNIKFERGKVRIQCVDSWKSLDDAKVPAVFIASLANSIASNTTKFALSVDPNTPLATSTDYYLSIESEVIKFTKDATQPTYPVAIDVTTRGYYSTTIDLHSVGDDVYTVVPGVPGSESLIGTLASPIITTSATLPQSFIVALSSAGALGGSTSGYLLIGTEIIAWALYSPSPTNLVMVTSTTRGFADTTAAGHSEALTVTSYHQFYGDPYLLMRDMLDSAGIAYDSSFADTSTAFTAITPLVGAVITSSTKLSTLFFELAEIFCVKVWLEIVSGVATAKMRSDILYDEWSGTLPTYISAMPTINDESGIIANSKSIENNETSIFTKLRIYYNTAIGVTVDVKEAINIFIGDLASRSNANYYGEIYKDIFARWFNAYNHSFDTGSSMNTLAAYLTYFTTYLGVSALLAHADANAKLTFESELKDEFYQGQFVKVTTNAAIDIYGNPITDQVFQVIEKSKTGLIKHKYLLEKVISYS